MSIIPEMVQLQNPTEEAVVHPLHNQAEAKTDTVSKCYFPPLQEDVNSMRLVHRQPPVLSVQQSASAPV